jgi:hypothetical protein
MKGRIQAIASIDLNEVHRDYRQADAGRGDQQVLWQGFERAQTPWGQMLAFNDRSR